MRGIRNVADDEATDISIKKTTMIAASRPAMSKTTEVHFPVIIRTVRRALGDKSLFLLWSLSRAKILQRRKWT